MKSVSFVIISVIGVLVVYFEFSQIHREGLFVFTPGSTLILISAGYGLISGIVRYQNREQLSAFIPFLTAIIFFCIVFFHKRWKTNLEESESVMTAYSSQIGTDGGLYMKFKKNGYVTMRKSDRFDITNYWGHYELAHDTVKLAISLDFKMGRTAVIRGDMMEIIGDTIRFQLWKP